MTLDEFIVRMNDRVQSAVKTGARPGAAFLAWFLVNLFRIDEDIAADYICDNTNDKGIDGVYVDDISEEVFILQSKYSSAPKGNQGDSDLRNFIGAKAWFETPENVEVLDNSFANQELKALVKRLGVSDKLRQGYELRLVFITSKVFDYNAKDYLQVVPEGVDAWDIDSIFDSFTYAGKDRSISGKFVFSVEAQHVIQYPISSDVEVLVFPAKATEIVKLDGIQDRSLFDRNVRFGLGKTLVNREIVKTLRQATEHSKFFLYHNGITLICSDFELNQDSVIIEDYAIVNGCQSTLTFYEQRALLSDDIKVLLRVIKTGSDEILGQRITYYNNNQNAISARDLRSNDKVQEDIYKQFLDCFQGQTLYKIKRGEDEASYATVIENDLAAQLIVSFLLKESHIAHQKTKLFEDRYNDVFSRHVTPHLIFLLYEMYQIVDSNSSAIKDAGMGSYRSTRFFFLYLFRLVLENDPSGQQLISDASTFYHTHKATYRTAFENLFKLLVLDLNNYVDDQKNGDKYFDYKNVLRNAVDVQNMAREIITSYDKGIVHHPEDSFQNLLRGLAQQT